MHIYQEIVDFLGSPVLGVRAQAVQCVLSLSTTPDAINFFSQSQCKCISALQSLCFDQNAEISHDSLKALINLTGNARIATDILSRADKDLFMDRLCLQITNPKHLLSDLCSMLMSNLTKFMAASMEKYQPMLQRWIENRCMDRMFDAFCRGRAYNPQADFHFLASVFTNLAASETFQEYLTSEKCGYPVKSLMIFTENENIIRRGGVIGTLKTLCLLSTGHHDALIDETKVNLLPCLLLPLAGPEEFSEDDMDGMPDELQLLSDDKEREKDKYLRRQLLDSLLALTATRPVREQMRQRKVYPILREAHLNETDPGCEETIQELVQMLMREEEQPQEEGKIMEIIEEETEEDSGQMAIEALI